MNIIVLAGGLSAERDVSFKTGEMVTKALRENGHQVILLDVFMGYSEREEELAGIFDRAEEVSVKVEAIPETAPDLAAVKAARPDQSDSFFGPNVIRLCRYLWLCTGNTGKMEKFRPRLICSAYATREAVIWGARLP